MDVILLDYIEKVGDKHEVVKVKNGYGRNYLIPKGMAIVANKSNMARLDGMKKQFAKKESAKVDTYRGFADQLAKATLKIVAKAGDSGRLFGSVNSQRLIDAIQETHGFEVEKRVIKMPEEVKELGSYEAEFRFHEEVSVVVKFDVVREKDAAEAAEAAPVAAAKKAVETVEAVVEATPEAVEEVVETVEAASEAVVEDVAEAVTETAAEAEATVESVEETVVEAVAETVETVEEAAETVAEAIEDETPADSSGEDDTDKAA